MVDCHAVALLSFPDKMTEDCRMCISLSATCMSCLVVQITDWNTTTGIRLWPSEALSDHTSGGVANRQIAGIAVPS